MANQRHEIKRPRQVTIAVGLIVFSALVGTALKLGHPAVTWASITRYLLPITMRFALWVVLALVIYQGRHWARIVFGVLTILSLPAMPFSAMRLAADVSPMTLLRLLDATSKIVALVLLFGKNSEAWFRPPEPAKRRRRGILFGALVVLALQVGLIIASSYYFAKDEATGSWDAFLALPLWYVSIVLAIVLAFFPNSNRLWIAKLAAILLAATTPFIAQGMQPAIAPLAEHRVEQTRERRLAAFKEQWDAGREERERRMKEKRERHRKEAQERYEEKVRIQAAELNELFDSPQTVMAGGEWYIVLDNLHCVKMYGMNHERENRRAFEAYVRDNVVGTDVEVRLPDDYLDRYVAGRRHPLAQEFGWPEDSRGDRFGDVYGLVFVNARLINLDYCKTEHRDALMAYQQAYTRGNR
jgi:hypothetical protein